MGADTDKTVTSGAVAPVAAVLPEQRNVAAGAATDKATAAIEEHRKRGRPPGSTKSSDPAGKLPKADKRSVAQAQEEITKALEELYRPEHWRGIVRAPADLMLATTGNRIWDLPKAEVDTLAAQSSLAARYFMATDPKWVALTLFAFSVATTYGSRAALHYKMKRDDRE